jgi:hypothetical protein
MKSEDGSMPNSFFAKRLKYYLMDAASADPDNAMLSAFKAEILTEAYKLKGEAISPDTLLQATEEPLKYLEEERFRKFGPELAKSIFRMLSRLASTPHSIARIDTSIVRLSQQSSDVHGQSTTDYLRGLSNTPNMSANIY